MGLVAAMVAKHTPDFANKDEHYAHQSSPIMHYRYPFIWETLILFSKDSWEFSKDGRRFVE
jgi:thiamine biosynthesis protein ThiC